MSRGRKPKSQNTMLNWQQFFTKNAGLFFQSIIIESSSLIGNQKETGLELLGKIKTKKEILISEKKLKKEKELPSIKIDEIPFQIPKNWVWCRLQEITKVITCGLASTPIYKQEGKIFLSAKNIKPFRFMPEDYKFVDEETYNRVTQNAKPEINDILITRVGAGIGETAMIDQEIDFAYYVSLTLVKPFSEIDSKYLVYWLNSPAGIESAISYTTGTGSSQGNLNVEKVRNFLIPLPPLSEQQSIVRFLDDFENNDLKLPGHYFNKDVEQKIINLHKSQLVGSEITSELNQQLSLVKKLRQQLLQDALQGKLVEQNPNDEPASELLKKIKAEKEKLIAEKKLKKEKELLPIKPEEIPFEIPENWVWCRLGEICNYGSSPKAEPKSLNGDTWVLDLEDIEKETSNLICKIRFNERNSLSTKSKFNLGEVLYSKLRPYLDKVIVADEDGVCTTEILPLKLYGDLNPFYIRFTLKRIDFLKYVNSVTKGMKMPRLGTTDGQMALIPLPPLSEQNRIVQKLDELMQYCNELEASIKQSESQNEKLLQRVLREALSRESVKELV